MAEVSRVRPRPNPLAENFQLAFLTRMIFSCLVDADSLATEAFTETGEGRPVPARGGRLDGCQLDAVRAHMARHRRNDTDVNLLRSRVLDHAVARAALPPGLLEHHSSFDWDERAPSAEGDREREGRAGLAKLRRDVENWDAPVVVTTAVQLFESLFTARRGRARKLHNHPSLFQRSVH